MLFYCITVDNCEEGEALVQLYAKESKLKLKRCYKLAVINVRIQFKSYSNVSAETHLFSDKFTLSVVNKAFQNQDFTKSSNPDCIHDQFWNFKQTETFHVLEDGKTFKSVKISSYHSHP